MAKFASCTLCLLALCSLPGGDSVNLSLQRRPLDVRPLSDGSPTRVARSVLAARVIDRHGNPVSLRSNSRPSRRRLISPFVTSHGRVTSQRRVTSHGRQQKTRTSSGNRRNYKRNEIHTRTISRSPARPSVRTSPTRWGGFGSLRNTISRQALRPKPVSTQRPPSSAVGAHSSPGSGGVFRQAQRGNTVYQRPTSTSTSTSTSSGTRSSGGDQGARRTRPRPEPVIGESVYSHALEAHMPPNARNMVTFLIQRSQRPRHYLDRTKGTGTVFTSHSGQCPVVDQSRCAPLSKEPLPPSCSNDYQCHGQESKCCYDPCLTINKCVRPVNG